MAVKYSRSRDWFHTNEANTTGHSLATTTSEDVNYCFVIYHCISNDMVCRFSLLNIFIVIFYFFISKVLKQLHFVGVLTVTSSIDLTYRFIVTLSSNICCNLKC